MRTFFASIGILVLLSLTPLSADPILPRTEKVILVADEWAPYNMTPGARKEGYILEIVREIFGAQGIEIEYWLVPWARALQDTRSGLYDGVIGASTSDAPGFVFPSEPLAINRLGFLTRKAFPWTYKNHASIESVSLGVIRGYDYRVWLSTYVERYRTDPRRIQEAVGDSPLETNLKKLVDNKLDVVVDSETALLYTSRLLGLQDQVRLAGRDTEPAFIHIAFTPSRQRQSERWAKILSDGIRTLRNSGRLQVILSGYGLSDWK